MHENSKNMNCAIYQMYGEDRSYSLRLAGTGRDAALLVGDLLVPAPHVARRSLLADLVRRQAQLEKRKFHPR